MEKLLFFLFSLFLFVCTHAQLTKLSNNKSLFGFEVNSQLLLLSYNADSSLWKINTDNSNPVEYSTKAKFEFGDAYIEIFQNKLFLNGRTDQFGYELWITDGTDEGTKMLKDINPGASSSNIHFFAEMNGLIFFEAETINFGKEIWVSDGTTEGTHIVKDINPGSEGVNFGFEKIINNGILYLIINDGIHGYELWRTDGTEDGTQIVKDINAGSGSSIEIYERTYFIGLENSIILKANNGIDGDGLWKSDGTETGTTLLTTLTPTGTTTSSTYFLFFKNRYFFPYFGQLWVTDGSAPGTYMVKDLIDAFGMGSEGFLSLSKAIIFGDKFIFLIRNSLSGEAALWSSDGTGDGTTVFFKPTTYVNEGIQVLPEYNFYKSSANHWFSDYVHTPYLNGKAFFYIENLASDDQLLITDGVIIDTLKSKVQFNYNDFVDEFYYRADSTGLFFSLYDSLYGSEPWKSDGTVTGTTLISDIVSGTGSSNPVFQLKYNGQQYFWANDGDNTEGLYDLFKIGGTLPVSLLSFSASLKNNDAVINWKTAMEYNASRFIIQRSKDGVNFSDIGAVNARNTGVQQQQYFYTDLNAFAGTNAKLYYRLKLLDKDGKFSLSKIALLSKSGSSISLSVSPNPVKNLLSINYNTGNVQVSSIRITDAAGHLVFVMSNLTANSSGQQTVNISKFAKGYYHVQLISGTEKKSIAFIKE